MSRGFQKTPFRGVFEGGYPTPFTYGGYPTTLHSSRRSSMALRRSPRQPMDGKESLSARDITRPNGGRFELQGDITCVSKAATAAAGSTQQGGHPLFVRPQTEL